MQRPLHSLETLTVKRSALVLVLFVSFIPNTISGEETAKTQLDGRDGRKLALQQFRPHPMLRVQHHNLQQAKFRVVDVHSHLLHKLPRTYGEVEKYAQVMDKHQIAISVSLDGKLGEQLDRHIEMVWPKYQDRFLIFANVNWMGDGDPDDPSTWACHHENFAHQTALALKDAVKRGVSGLKLFKAFGLTYKNPDGSLIQVDDPRWDGIWQACSQLGIPVIMHVADPAAFFLPIDETNERWEELHRHPDWSFAQKEFPTREELLEARNRIIARHPKTKFIGAHMANNSEDLQQVGKWLDTYPNLYVEIASRISELGRQPYTARQFFLDYQDRIMLGTDGPWPEQRLTLYWRFLETFDEYFPYSEKPFPPQGLWRIYGIGLPDEVLKKVYHENAAKIIPGVAERLLTQRTNEPRS